MKKKGLFITITVLLILVITSLITGYIDTANVTTGHEPECCIKTVSRDGNKVTYWGLGYKVVRYVGVSPNEPYKNNIGVKMGSWFMKFEKPTNVILDVTAFETNHTFKISEKADVDFIIGLLKNSKYINEPCDGIADYAITYDNNTYDILISCSEIKRGNKQAKISDKDMEELKRILVGAETSTAIREIPAESVSGITPQEAEKLCFVALGEKDEETGFPFSFGVSGAVQSGNVQYYVVRASWLVNQSHLSYIGDFFVSADGKEIYSGTALNGAYTMENVIWKE